MTDVAVLLPVLGRPARVAPLLASLRASERVARLYPLFLLSTEDPDEFRAVSASGARYLSTCRPAGPGDYARKINLGYRLTWEPWIFTGADDLEFEPGWADEALRVAALEGVRVIGTCDGAHNPRVESGDHSTHSLVARTYAAELGTIDGPDRILHDGYDHWYVDDELVGTAKARGEWAFAEDSCVLHRHPLFGTAPNDATYERGRTGNAADGRLYQQRRRLWRP